MVDAVLCTSTKLCKLRPKKLEGSLPGSTFYLYLIWYLCGSLWKVVFLLFFFIFFSFRGSCSLTELCAYSKVQSADASNRVAEMLRPRHHSTYYKSLDHQNHSKTVLDAALTSMAHWLSVCILVLTLQHSLTRSKVYPIVFIGIHTC